MKFNPHFLLLTAKMKTLFPSADFSRARPILTVTACLGPAPRVASKSPAGSATTAKKRHEIRRLGCLPPRTLHATSHGIEPLHPFHPATRGIGHLSYARHDPVNPEQTFLCGMLTPTGGGLLHPLRPKSPSFLAARRLHCVDLHDAPWLPGATCLSVCAHSKTARFVRAFFWSEPGMGCPMRIGDQDELEKLNSSCAVRLLCAAHLDRI